MPHSSPLMKMALELFAHSIEHYVAGSPRDRRFAVLHLAHSLELATKSILVTANRPIYRDEGSTLSAREALRGLGREWDCDRAPYAARIELLIDERNGIQHRFGTIDDLTMDYHMETAFMFMAEVFARQYGLDFHQYVRESLSLPEEVWRACRFVKEEHEERINRARELVSTNPTAALLEAFSALEVLTHSRAKSADSGAELFSTLDVLMKFGNRLADRGLLDRSELGRLPEVFRLRNAMVHGEYQTSEDEVRDAVRTISCFADVLARPGNEEDFAESIGESLRGAVHRPLEYEPEETVTDVGLLRVIARRQLRYPPPRFVGAKLLATELGAQQLLGSLIDRDLVNTYQVPNPLNPEYPTSAVRVNLDNAEVASLIGEDLAAELRRLAYP